MYRGHWTAQGVAAPGRRIYEERWAFAWARESYPEGVFFLIRVGERSAG